MKLREIDFGPIIGASGIQGIFGEGYPYHRQFRLIPGFGFDGLTFTAKTVTLNRNEGNMPLEEDGLTPRERRPRCIYVTPRTWIGGYALNAVGLSNFGAKFYLDQCRWQARTDAFFISFMSIKPAAAERLTELRAFVEMLLADPVFCMLRRKMGLQINLSCPNVGLNLEDLLTEALTALEIAQRLGIPIVLKFNLLVRPYMIQEIAAHRACDAVCVSNTIPWGTLQELIDWRRLFGTNVSPFQARFKSGGGLSGKPLFPLLIQWLRESRGVITKPIIAGGGILHPDDVRKLADFANVWPSLGSISFLRPWRMKSCIRLAHEIFQ